MANDKELNFLFIKFDEEKMLDAECRLVCIEAGQVIEIYEGTVRNCINRQLEMLYIHGIAAEKFRVRKGDK